MRDIATKVDSSTSLNANEFNSFIVELENLVTRAGISLDASAGPDNDLLMLARSVLIHSQAGMSYQDNGAANTFVLAPIQATFEQPTAYVDGMTVQFKAAATNTGACTINVDGLGAISLTKAGGTAYAAGEIVAGNIITAQFFNGTNRFEEVSNTTPEASSPAAADQVAVYADSGSASQVTLSVEPGYTQPSAFTDQMVVLFKANATNDGAGTHPVNVTGLGIKDMVEKDGSNPVAGRITADDWVMLVFREVRDEFEIAFVYDNPTPAAMVPVTVSSSSGTLVNLLSTPEVKAPTSYTDGMVIIFNMPQTNTASVDINLNGIGAKDLRNEFGGNFSSGEVAANAMVVARFVLSEDRFRAHIGRAVGQTLTSDRTCRLTSRITGTFARNTDVLVNWNTPASSEDELGFYDPPTDTAVVPAGQDIERVDIAFNVTSTTDNDNYFTASILLNGSLIAAQTTTRTAGAQNASCSVVAMDVPVSSGNRIDGQVRIDGGTDDEALVAGSLVVRVSKFAAP